jgi:hypothetical protein
MKLLFENWRKYLDERGGPALSTQEIEDMITDKYSFNSAKTSQHRWGRGQPIIDYNLDRRGSWFYTASIPDEVNANSWNDIESYEGEDLETFLRRVHDTYSQIELDVQKNLFYGTSTIFQQEITENGIKSPSEWGNYGLAEENAMKIVEEHGGEPMVIQMPRSEFDQNKFKIDENNNDSFIYTETFIIGLQKQEKKLL